jgi:hypothetical protein
MADFSINVPGTGNITMRVGDTLTVHFVGDCRFCFDSGLGNCFNSGIPAGQHRNTDSWAAVARTAGTITHHSVGHDEDCSRHVELDAARSIQITSN